MAEIGILAWILAAAWLVDFVALLPVSLFLLGVGTKGEPPYTILFIGGLIHWILGISAVTLGDIYLGFAILVFGWIFVGIGYMAYRGFEPVGIAGLALSTAIMYALYGIYDAVKGFYDWAVILFTITAILLFVAALDYGKISSKVCGVALMAFSFEALFIAAAMMFGILVY